MDSAPRSLRVLHRSLVRGGAGIGLGIDAIACCANHGGFPISQWSSRRGLHPDTTILLSKKWHYSARQAITRMRQETRARLCDVYSACMSSAAGSACCSTASSSSPGSTSSSSWNSWSQPMYESHMKKSVRLAGPAALGATKSSLTLDLYCLARGCEGVE